MAESLKTGRSVMPEAFESVSVLFVDIVCFPAISARSTPAQLVAFLNALYAEFDDIIARHDAYKVETVGDAYLLVSGLPVRNGNRHAAELAHIALEFRSAALAFRIAHLPRVPLLTRAGIHTGPVFLLHYNS